MIDAIKDDSGQLLGFAKITRDITDRVQAARELEEARISLKLAHVARVTTLGELTASIAHELRQPLSGVLSSGNASLNRLANQPPNIEKAIESIERVIRAANRSREVIERVLALSRQADSQNMPLIINDVVKEVIQLMEREVSSHQVSLRMELAPDLPLVFADQIQLQQDIINLVMNGIEAMQPVMDRPRELVIRSSRGEADQMLVAVKDCGVGISAENVDRLFTAFFTTKSSGMGMGLSICRSIIQAHGGRMSAANNTGPGATFQFTLPLPQEDSP